MRYIDSEKLIAEIERLSAEHSSKYGMDEAAIVLDKLEDFIASLQQERTEVDIEKEIDERAENMPHGEFTHDSECVEHEEWAKREFRHFYELGLNARTEEQI